MMKNNRNRTTLATVKIIILPLRDDLDKHRFHHGNDHLFRKYVRTTKAPDDSKNIYYLRTTKAPDDSNHLTIPKRY
jgi:hypothetical protein